MMFRKVEFFILGDAAAQKQLKNAAWSGNKIVLITCCSVSDR